jgi:hypothetical protein
MKKKKTKNSEQEKIISLLQDLLIVSLATAGVPQLEIRKILAVDIVRVNRIVKFFRK